MPKKIKVHQGSYRVKTRVFKIINPFTGGIMNQGKGASYRRRLKKEKALFAKGEIKEYDPNH